MTLPAGSRFGQYEVLSALGAGGMGEVYRARDPRLGRDVAVKIIAAGPAASGDRLRRFRDEARAAGALNHPNVLTVYDVGVDGEAPFIVFELLEGETLRQRLERGRLAVRDAVWHAVQACHGLAAAHDKRIIHRDLKPENLFITADGRVKILDFGIAKLELGAHDAADPRVTETTPGILLGTAAYMSPEQARGRPADQRSDVFALGACLYEMLSGRPAFRGATVADTVAAILTKDPEPIGEATVPDALEHVVQ